MAPGPEMYIKDERSMLEQLNAALAIGQHWVAIELNDRSFLRPETLLFFRSRDEAQYYCRENSVFATDIEQDPLWPEDDYRHFKCLLTAELKTLITGEQLYAGLDVANAKAQLEALDARLLPGSSEVELLRQLGQGKLQPVIWAIDVEPLRLVMDFHVIQRRHGDLLRPEARPFDSYRAAKRWMKALVAQHEATGKRDSDLILAGRFAGAKLLLDMDGQPEAQTGLTFDMAAPLRTGRYKWHHVTRLHEITRVHRCVLAGYDRRSGRIELMNDRLEPFRPHLFYTSHELGYYQIYSLTIRSNVMLNQKNHDYLSNQVKYLGFGENQGEALKKQMEEGKESFTLPFEVKFGSDDVNATLHFKRMKDSADMYAFNSFDMTVKRPGDENEVKQTYYVGQVNNFTVKERYNMLEGRAVFKELYRLEKVGEGADARYKPTDQTYKAWNDLSFKSTDNGGNFLIRKAFWDHEKTLAKFPIKEMEDNYDKSRLVAALEKGNLARVTVIQEGQETKMSVAANPNIKSFDFFDSSMQRVNVKQVETQKLDQAEKKKEGENVAKDQTERKSNNKRHQQKVA